MKTIFILAPDRETYAKWFEQYGFKLINVEMTYIHSVEEIKGYSRQSTFFTIIGDIEDDESTKILRRLQNRFGYIPKERLEEAVKGRKSRKVKA